MRLGAIISDLLFLNRSRCRREIGCGVTILGYRRDRRLGQPEVRDHDRRLSHCKEHESNSGFVLWVLIGCVGEVSPALNIRIHPVFVLRIQYPGHPWNAGSLAPHPSQLRNHGQHALDMLKSAWYLCVLTLFCISPEALGTHRASGILMSTLRRRVLSWIFMCWTQHFYLISSVSPFVYLFPLSLLATSPLASHKTRIQGTDRSYNGDPVRVCPFTYQCNGEKPQSLNVSDYSFASVCHSLLDSKLPRHLIAR